MARPNKQIGIPDTIELRIEIDRCDRKIVEMLARRTEAVKKLHRCYKLTAMKPLVCDGDMAIRARLPFVCETYNANYGIVKPIFNEMLQVFEAFEIHGAPKE